MAKMQRLMSAMLLAIAFCALSRAVLAQDAYSIRVESNQVLVPTFVFDKTRMARPGRPSACPAVDTEVPGKQSSVSKAPTNCRYDLVTDLAARDFHLFEDGKEQIIQSVRLQFMQYTDVHDSTGHFVEESDTPTARWSTSALPRIFSPGDRMLFYLIAYSPPRSADGTCHQIKVKADRRNSNVWARTQYCNTQHSPSDPLLGTRFGQQLQGYVASAQADKIDLSLQAGVFYPESGIGRIDIALEFPWNSLKREWSNGSLHATIGVLGIVNGKDGNLAARFSDQGCCPSDRPEFVETQEAGTHFDPPGLPSVDQSASVMYPDFDVDYLPGRYETQIDLGTGEYVLNVVLSDGSKFGRVETPLIVDSYDGNHLALSSVMLCKRFRDAATSSQEAAAVNQAPKFVPLVSKGMEFTPAGDTRFKKGDAFFAYFEVYEPLLASAPTTTVQTELRIIDVKTGELKADSGPRSAADWIQPGKTVIPIADKIEAAKLPPGSYRLEVQASDSAGNSTTWRTRDFLVE